MKNTPLLKIQELHFGFQSKKVLRGLNFELQAGELLGIIGASGSGKTSLLKVLAGLYSPQKGRIIFKGKVLPSADQLLIPGHEELHLVQQDFDLLPMLTVDENIARQLRHLSDRQQAQRALVLRGLLDLNRLKNRRADQLSGGQRQRIAIATAIAAQPQLLLLDEAFSNLDYPLKRRVLELMRNEWNPEGLIMVGHEPEELLSLCDRLLVLQNGKVIQCDKSDIVFDAPVNRYAAELLGPISIPPKKELHDLNAPVKSTMLRPHKLRLSESGLKCEVQGSEYQGRDYLIEAKSVATGSTFYLYHLKPLTKGRQIFIKHIY